MPSLKERLLTPGGARAVTAPSAILLAGAGMSAAILAGLPIAAAGLVGAAAWAGKVALGIPKLDHRDTGRIEPQRLGDPWRRYVAEALEAQQRFGRAVANTSPGPLRDRLQQIGRQVDTAVAECWRIARRGNALVGARQSIDVEQAREELAALERNADESWFAGSDAERTAEALRAQISSAERVASVAREARDKLQLLDARLDEAVARAIELSVRADEPAELGGLGSDVDALVGELEDLREALEETGG